MDLERSARPSIKPPLAEGEFVDLPPRENRPMGDTDGTP